MKAQQVFAALLPPNLIHILFRIFPYYRDRRRTPAEQQNKIWMKHDGHGT